MEEPATLVKIQIDNSLDLGWEKEDIILATNFPFKYNGVKSIVVSDQNNWLQDKRQNKHTAILELFTRGVINKLNPGELYWFHDLDAYQSETITEFELGMEDADMALCDYGWREKWSTGSIFFTPGARNIFKGLLQTMSFFKSTDEITLMMLMNKLTKEETDELKQRYNPDISMETPRIRDIDKRIKKINTSYNFVPYFNVKYCYNIAIKPIKVVHFHPSRPRLEFFMYGKNDINTVFMPDRLINIFHHHGIK